MKHIFVILHHWLILSSFLHFIAGLMSAYIFCFVWVFDKWAVQRRHKYLSGLPRSSWLCKVTHCELYKSKIRTLLESYLNFPNCPNTGIQQGNKLKRACVCIFSGGYLTGRKSNDAQSAPIPHCGKTIPHFHQAVFKLKGVQLECLYLWRILILEK